MENNICVISNSPIRDIREFVNYCSEIVMKYDSKRIMLKDGITLVFHSDRNLDGIRRYYYYHEVFENYLKTIKRNLKYELEEKEKVIIKITNMINSRSIKIVKGIISDINESNNPLEEIEDIIKGYKNEK